MGLDMISSRNSQLRCPEVSEFFERFQNGRYVPKPWLRDRYPMDWIFNTTTGICTQHFRAQSQTQTKKGKNSQFQFVYMQTQLHQHEWIDHKLWWLQNKIGGTVGIIITTDWHWTYLQIVEVEIFTVMSQVLGKGRQKWGDSILRVFENLSDISICLVNEGGWVVCYKWPRPRVYGWRSSSSTVGLFLGLLVRHFWGGKGWERERER